MAKQNRYTKSLNRRSRHARSGRDLRRLRNPGKIRAEAESRASRAVRELPEEFEPLDLSYAYDERESPESPPILLLQDEIGGFTEPPPLPKKKKRRPPPLPGN